MPNQLAKSIYQKLLLDISKIYEQARLQSVRTVNKIVVRAHWEIGRRIVQDEQNYNIRAKYRKRVLENLSRDLTKKYERGFSVTNLKCMRQFYFVYPIGQTSDQLGWSHYQVLLTVKDKQKRRFYERQAIKKNWSSRKLHRILLRGKIQIEDFSAGPRPEGKPVAKLNFTCGKLYTYKLAR